jgi:hypothetical protein
MKRFLTIAILAVAALTANASAQQLQSSFGIKLTGCHVFQQAHNLANVTGGVWVKYTNTRAVPATRIDFLVKYNGVQTVMVDKGSFTQYAQIQHSLQNALIGQAWIGPTPTSCRVYHVYWANGNVSK